MVFYQRKFVFRMRERLCGELPYPNNIIKMNVLPPIPAIIGVWCYFCPASRFCNGSGFGTDGFNYLVNPGIVLDMAPGDEILELQIGLKCPIFAWSFTIYDVQQNSHSLRGFGAWGGSVVR